MLPSDLPSDTPSPAIEAFLRFGKQHPAGVLEPLVADAPIGFALVDPHFRCVYVNRALAERNEESLRAGVGRSVEETLGTTLWNAVRPYFEQALTGSTIRGQEITTTLPSDANNLRHFSVSCYPVRAEGMEVTGVGVIVADVTERRRRGDALTGGQNAILEQIAIGAPLGEILAAIALLIERQASTRLVCSILLVDTRRGILRLGAGPSLAPEYAAQLRDGFPIGPTVGTCGVAAFHKTSVFTGNLATDSNWAMAGPSALRVGLHACWSTPILGAAGEALGTFGVFYPEPRDAPGNEERELVAVAVHVARIAIERDRIEESRRTLLREILLSLTEERLRLCLSADDLPAPLCETERCNDGWFALTEARLPALRKRVMQAATDAGMNEDRAADLETAAHEAGMNAVVHAPKAEASARILVDTKKGVVQVWVSDAGSGIPEPLLHRAILERGYTTANGFGHGFYLILQTADRIYLQTSPKGTALVIEQERVEPRPGWLIDRMTRPVG